jgi:hypothetical protein
LPGVTGSRGMIGESYIFIATFDVELHLYFRSGMQANL